MKKGQFAIIVALILLCAGGIFGYVYYRLDKMEKNKIEEKHDEKQNNQENTNKPDENNNQENTNNINKTEEPNNNENEKEIGIKTVTLSHLCLKENKKKGDVVTKNDFKTCETSLSVPISDLSSYTEKGNVEWAFYLKDYIRNEGVLTSTETDDNDIRLNSLFNREMLGTKGLYDKVVLNRDINTNDIIYIKDFDMYIPKGSTVELDKVKFYVKDAKVYYEGYGTKDVLIFDKEPVTEISNWASCCGFEKTLIIYTNNQNTYLFTYFTDDFSNYVQGKTSNDYLELKKLNIEIKDAINRYYDFDYLTPHLLFITANNEVITESEVLKR